MLSDKFLRHFFRLSSVCYRKGCLDACWEGNASQLDGFLHSVRQPDTYGTLGGKEMSWRQWAYTLSLWLCTRGDLQDMLMNMKSDHCAESAYLRIFQEMYICGASEYFGTRSECSREALMGVGGMFLLDQYGRIKKVVTKKMLEKTIDCVYARVDSDTEMVERGSDGRGFLSRNTYERVIKDLWVAKTSKNKWYD